MTYEDFVSRLSKTKYTAETMEQYRKMPKGQQDNIKDVGGFVLGKLKGGALIIEKERLRDIQIRHHA